MQSVRKLVASSTISGRIFDGKAPIWASADRGSGTQRAYGRVSRGGEASSYRDTEGPKRATACDLRRTSGRFSGTGETRSTRIGSKTSNRQQGRDNVDGRLC